MDHNQFQFDEATKAIVSDPKFEILTTMNYSAGLAKCPAPGPLGDPSPSQETSCYLLQYSIDRLIAAASDFGWSTVLANLKQSPGRLASVAADIDAYMVSTHGENDVRDGAKRFILRLAYKSDGKMTMMSQERPPIAAPVYYPMPQLPGPTVTEDPAGALFKCETVHLSKIEQPPMSPSLFTRHKTTHRAAYTEALVRAKEEAEATATPPPGEVLLWNEKKEVMGCVFHTVYFWRDGGWITPPRGTGCKMGISRRWAVEHAGVSEATVLVDEIVDGEVVWLSCGVNGFSKGKIYL